MPKIIANLDVENDLWSRYKFVGGMDEVGRGAWAGPVVVGMTWVRKEDGPCPKGLADSKLLTPAARAALVDPIKNWVSAWGIGECSAQKIDQIGLARALKIAAWRAFENSLRSLSKEFLVVNSLSLIVDGNHNYLTADSDLFDTAPQGLELIDHFHTKVKADQECASVAAASVLAKEYRDQILRELPDPGYGWAQNKGYPSARHRQVIADLGLNENHRRSWKLPKVFKDGTMKE